MEITLIDSIAAYISGEPVSHSPRYVFSGPLIEIGAYTDRTQRGVEITDTFGSLRWLWADDDEMRFHRSNGDLSSVCLYVPGELCSRPEIFTQWLDTPVLHGSLRLSPEQNFALPQTVVQWADECARHLICLRDTQSTTAGENYRLRFAPDTDLLVINDHWAGWMITDPARYLTADWNGPCATEPDEATRSALGACLRLTTSPGVEEIMDGDDTSWQLLRSTAESLRKQQVDRDRASILLSVLDQLIEDYSDA